MNVTAKPTSHDTDGTWKSIRQYLQLLLSLQGRKIPVMLGLSFVSSLFSGVGILLLVPLLDLVNGTEGPGAGVTRFLARAFDTVGLAPTLETVLISFLVLLGLQSVIGRSSSLLNSRMQHDLTLTLQRRMLEAVALCRWSHFLRTRRSDFLHVLTSDVNRVAGGTNAFQSLASATLLAIVHVAASICISPVFSALTLLLVGVLWPVWLKLNQLSMNLGQRQTGGAKDFYHSLEQMLAGMKEIKSLGGEPRQITSIHGAIEELKTSQLDFQKINATTNMVINIGSATFLCSMLFVAVRWFNVPAVELLVLAYVFSKLIPRLRRVQSSYQQILNTLPAYRSMMALQTACEAERELGVPLEPFDSNHAPRNDDEKAQYAILTTARDADASSTSIEKQSLRLGPTIEFNQVNFRYNQDRSIWALRDIDLTIPSNRTTALVGPSGAGKSTMADLLMGLLLPQDGDLQVDGKVLTEEQLWHWRQRIGYVPQETFLLHDSIRNNLLWAEPDATAEELQRVLEMSCADRFVDRLPDGIETVVGDRGVRLSGGERQRLALARALLRRPDLLILDEATSHLDAENQQRIHESIQRMQGRLTVVIIAHRLSTIRDADQIICLDKGLVVETGSYRDLSERPESVFNSLIRADDRTGSSAG
ncbi:MAG: ABC transporter ATP-binding protein [Planctomycetales bacterium]